MNTTTDLAKFGHRERKMAEDLLRTWREKGLPEDFYDEEVIIMMNDSSGNVFLTNTDYQVAMMNREKLESFYTCPICGHEGFINEMEHNIADAECQAYLIDIEV